MDWLATEFRTSFTEGDGPRLANTLLPPSHSPDIVSLDSFYRECNEDNVHESVFHIFQGQGQKRIKVPKAELNAWAEVYTSFWKFLGNAITNRDDAKVRRRRYESWKEMTNAIIRGFSNGDFEAWALPCLYVAGRWLRTFAIEADEEEHEKGKDASKLTAIESDDIAATMAKNDTLEDAARVINRMFTLCINDRAPIVESRKWGLYYVTNLLFKTYFKLNSVSLCKNAYRAMQASHVDMPPLSAFPKAHIVTFRFYTGLMFFLEEDYATAESNLLSAFNMCHRSISPASTRNRERILSYLIPCRLLTSRQLPQQSVLQPSPRLQRLFTPICEAIRTGNLAKYDAALAAGEAYFVKARMYLTLERARDLCLRNLFRKVFVQGGFEEATAKDGSTGKIRRTRIPVEEFVAAVKCSLGSDPEEVPERDEVECMLANLIFKNLIKGYIARERGIVVLSKSGAFPGAGA